MKFKINLIVRLRKTIKLKGSGQPSLVQAVSNCEKRAIGSNGGFGYKAIKEEIEIALLDSVILAYWACSETKVKRRKQRISC